MSLVAEFIKSQGASDEFEAARRVVEKHFAGRDPEVAVDLDEIARKHRIRVDRADDTPFEGMIERDPDGSANVVLRRGLNRARERFTLAHELGHWLLQEEMIGTVEGQLFRGVSRNAIEMRDEERLASLLAAEILMPYGPVKSLYQDDRRLRSLTMICRRFGVSRMAAVRRVADVCDKNMVFLQLVPYLFKRLDSAAEIDDAVFVSARTSTLFDRERTRLVDKFPFERLLSGPVHDIRLRTPKGPVRANFEVEYRETPIPHVFALGSGVNWGSQRVMIDG